MAYEFGRSPTYLKIIYANVIQHLTRRYCKILTLHPSLDRDKAYYFANVLSVVVIVQLSGVLSMGHFVDFVALNMVNNLIILAIKGMALNGKALSLLMELLLH